MQTPLNFTWDGEAMVPTPHSIRLLDEHFVIGERYQFVLSEERSQKSHNHYFALLKEAWQNLPEVWADKLPTQDHARKFALIATGYCDERTIVAPSHAAALKIASFVRPIDEYAVVDVMQETAVVRVRTAKSQSMRAMGRAVFQKSKDDVLGYLAGLGGYDASELGRAA